jgi:hypothetical protein
MFFTYRRANCQPGETIAVDAGSVGGLHDTKPVDLFDAWLFAEAECGLALQGWCAAAVEEKAAAHAAYNAALDDEERAARTLCDRLHIAGASALLGSAA